MTTHSNRKSTTKTTSAKTTVDVTPLTDILTVGVAAREMTALANKLADLRTRMEVLTDCCSGAQAEAYNRHRQIFNTKFQFRPSAIFLPQTTDDVAEVVKIAASFPTLVRLRARSGGHDHEGECSGTDTWVIDFNKMTAITRDEKASRPPELNVVRIQAGTVFRQIKATMDQWNLGIPHGTCATVSPTGYTLGGGWGPWTRRYGMSCERLIGATVVKGDGSIINASVDDLPGSEGARLLWALRGGGGFSYGIVTELMYNAFELPSEAHSFQVSFVNEAGEPDRSAISVLRDWERMVAGDNYPNLTGTNLMISATHIDKYATPDPDAKLMSTFNGYYAGAVEEIHKLIRDAFGEQYLPRLRIREYIKSNENGVRKIDESWHFHSWDRIAGTVHADGEEITIDPSIQLEQEGPAPHKITSRLADEKGWDEESRRALICTLQSPLAAPVSVGGTFGVHCYITIGAIAGPFYSSRTGRESTAHIAFPYTRRPFTLQFQAWWDQFYGPNGEPVEKASPTIIHKNTLANRPWINRAEDWIEACRDARIPHTSGAFISFKDDAVKTEVYFAQHYDDLRRVKRECSADPHLLFQTRKTII